jgi:N-acetylglucosaminyldiphosphoundecaprenol N-acetyl-beta-D-mannosaminyltransferase
MDFVGSFLLILLALPLMLVAALLVRSGGSALHTETRIGAWGEPFQLVTFKTGSGRAGRLLERTRLHLLPVLFNVLKGDLSFVGPRAVSPAEVLPRERLARRRFSVRPGLVSLWWIRKRANIDFGTELESDSEYASTQSVKGDLGIVLRAVPTALYGASSGELEDRVVIQGITIDNVTMGEAIEDILALTKDPRPKQICYVNAHCANVAWKDKAYFDVVTSSTRIWADGIGVKLAGKILGRQIKQNVNGTDLFPRLCEAMAGGADSLYFLGAKPGVAEAVKDWVAEHYPGATVAGVQDGFFAPEDEEAVVQRIASSGATILMVAFGVPKQDVWIAERWVSAVYLISIRGV